jgi:hypothetical protein
MNRVSHAFLLGAGFVLLTSASDVRAQTPTTSCGVVTAGTTVNLTKYRAGDQTCWPKSAAKIVGMAVLSRPDASSLAFTFYDDGTFGSGPTNSPDSSGWKGTWPLPAGYSHQDVVGIGATVDPAYADCFFAHVYTKQGFVLNYKLGCGAGTQFKTLSLWTEPKPYTLAAKPGGGFYSPGDLAGIAIDDSNSWVFAFYKDGNVSAGTSIKLDQYRKPSADAKYTPLPGKTLIDFAIDGKNHYVFAFYQ